MRALTVGLSMVSVLCVVVGALLVARSYVDMWKLIRSWVGMDPQDRASASAALVAGLCGRPAGRFRTGMIVLLIGAAAAIAVQVLLVFRTF